MTVKQDILNVLFDGIEHSPQEIGRICKCQHNTALKCLKYLRDDGYIINKRRIENDDGTHYYLYRLINPEEKKCTICDRLNEYKSESREHNQIPKIIDQIRNMIKMGRCGNCEKINSL